MATPGQAAAWLETERANLHAATGYAAASGRLRHAMLIPAAMADFLEAGGHGDQALALHKTALAAARQAGDRPGQARALMRLARPQLTTGDSAAAAAVQQALALYGDLGDRVGQGQRPQQPGLCLPGWAATINPPPPAYQQALELFRGLGNRRGEAQALSGLGVVQQRPGTTRPPRPATSRRWSCPGTAPTGTARACPPELGGVQRLTGDYPAAAATFHRPRRWTATSATTTSRPAPNQLGALQRLTGDYRAAAASQQQALAALCDLGEPAGQGFARNELGLVQQETGDYPAAAASHQQALRLLRDAGEPYGQA